jgi:hypothetical protein
MNAKYFKTLPEQEYIFKNFYTTGKKEGVCCADCGTYITNVVQLFGKADRQVYEVGTTCCEKISKDRSVFLTPLSEQRKKIFMNQFKKHQKVVAELEDVAELNGGAEVRFADVSIDYMQSLDITLFIFCKNGYIAFNHLEHCERDFSGLKELTRGFEFDLPFAEEMEKTWNRDLMLEIKKLVGEAWYNEGARCGFESLWEKWFFRNYPQLKEQFKHIPTDVPMGECFHKGKEYKTCPMAF